ncbi:hypothetical protein FQN49_003501 [Arthroderma sp. PD_2]|nr:hypothetical protein FQN49_003501 [Arthroderma sp. PD_2]
MPLFASLFSRRRSRQAGEKNAPASNAVQKNGTNHTAPRVELDLPHIKPSEAPPQLELDIAPRTPARNDDDAPVNPASIELPTSPQSGRPESPGTVVSKKRSLLSVRSLQANDGQQQQQYFKEGKRRPRRMSVFSSLRSRPSTGMSTATEPVPEFPQSPVTPNAYRTHFPPDPKFQLDLKPEAFGKAFNGSSLPFVEEAFGDNPETSRSPGWQGQQKTGDATTTTTPDSGNHVSRGWILPDLKSVIDGDTLNTNTDATLTQPSSPANGTSQQTPNANSDKTEKSSSDSLPSPASLPPLPASPESGSSKSASRSSLKRFLSKRQSPHLLRGNTPSPSADATTTTATNGVTA